LQFTDGGGWVGRHGLGDWFLVAWPYGRA